MTEEQIKEAFMRTFAGAGEIWLPYVFVEHRDKTAEEIAQERADAEGLWDDFKEHLDNVIAGKP